MSSKLKYLEWFGVLTAIAYSLFVASNVGLEFLGFILLFVSAISIGLWAYFGGHRGILLLQFFYAAAGLIGMVRWFQVSPFPESFDVIEPFLSGFLLGLSLILAIGPQNAFVLRQGLLRQHALAVVLFCALSDALLITVGIAGLSLFISDLAAQYSAQLFGLAALWLSVYGVQRLRDAWRGESGMQAAAGSHQGLSATLGMAALLTFGNPHVYLDTVVLLGTLSLQYAGAAKVAFGLGAVMASLTFFSLLALGARALSPLMGTTRSWRIIDTVIACVMFALAYGLLQSGGLMGGNDVVTAR